MASVFKFLLTSAIILARFSNATEYKGCTTLNAKTNSVALIMLQDMDLTLSVVKIDKVIDAEFQVTVKKSYKKRSLPKNQKLIMRNSLNCTNILRRKKYYVLLKKVEDNKYDLIYSPVISGKIFKEAKKTICCKKCKLSPPKFKKSFQKEIKRRGWVEKEKVLSITCKLQRNHDKPAPRWSWYLDNEPVQKIKYAAVSIKNKKSKSTLTIKGGKYLEEDLKDKFKCMAETPLGQANQTIDVHYLANCTRCDSKNEGTCNTKSGNICCMKGKSVYCKCGFNWHGNRCEIRVTSTSEKPPKGAVESSMTAGSNVLVMAIIVGVLMVALIVISAFFLSARSKIKRQKRSSINGYSSKNLVNKHLNNFDKPRSSSLTPQKAKNSNGSLISEQRPRHSSLTPMISPMYGRVTEKKNSHPSITSFGNGGGRKRLNGIANNVGKRGSKSPPSSPHYDNLTTEEQKAPLVTKNEKFPVTENLSSKSSSNRSLLFRRQDEIHDVDDVVLKTTDSRESDLNTSSIKSENL